MRKIFNILVFALLAFLFTGCLSTLHPIFTTNDLVYDPKLIGPWNYNHGKVVITNLATESSIELPGNISAIKQKGYLIVYHDEESNQTVQYIAFLARIGKHRYLDYYPASKKDDQNHDKFFNSHFFKLHTPYRLDISKDGSFALSRLAGGNLIKLIEEKKIHITHESSADEESILITASTSDIQRYLIKYGDEPAAYESERTFFKK